MLNDVLAKAKAQFSGKLETIRAQIRECGDEISWLHTAPQPLEEALQNIDRFIRQKQQEFDMMPFFNASADSAGNHPLTAIGDKPGIYPHVFVDGHPVAASPRVIVDEAHLWCTLQPGTVKVVLYEQAERFAETIQTGPPLAERPQLIEAAKQRLYALEVEEEKLISEAESAGLDGFFRRHDVNPEIVLNRDEEIAHA
jgi:hypothetical protein